TNFRPDSSSRLQRKQRTFSKVLPFWPIGHWNTTTFSKALPLAQVCRRIPASEQLRTRREPSFALVRRGWHRALYCNGSSKIGKDFADVAVSARTPTGRRGLLPHGETRHRISAG